jgi:hypothetical protein
VEGRERREIGGWLKDEPKGSTGRSARGKKEGESGGKKEGAMGREEKPRRRADRKLKSY